MKSVITILFFIPVYIYGQDITGVWTGYLKTPGSQLKYELAISEGGKNLSGYSMIVYVNDGVENIGIKTAKIKQHKNEILFEDGELVYDNYKIPPKRAKLFGSVVIHMKDTLMTLRGSFATRSLDMRDDRRYYGEVFLQKEKNFSITKMLPKLEELRLLNTLSFANPRNKKKPVKKTDTTALAKKQVPKEPVATPPPVVRRVEKIRDLTFISDSLVFAIYDNGTIDGDTVSLILNGRVIADNVGLSTQAFRITVPTPAQSDSLQLIMYAESLGTIPPNTGLLIINDGNTRHEILFESDLQKSSVITLRRRKQ